MIYGQYFRTFFSVLDAYISNIQDAPLTKFLPSFFRKNKQMGARDRRTLSDWLYHYFRLGHALSELQPQERLCFAEFLCNPNPVSFLQYFRPDLIAHLPLNLDEKIYFLEQHAHFNLNDVFPWTTHCSSNINTTQFLKSFFIQPDLYIRMHPGKEAQIKTELMNAKVSYREITKNALALPIGTKLDQVLRHQAYEIQDISSQQTAGYFKPEKQDYWWDACAASGGKSLSLFSEEAEIKILVSDIRANMLDRLDSRFKNAGLRNYHKKIIDLREKSAMKQIFCDTKFDGIILDAPCSGSGTWGRTPEMISQFDKSKIQSFQDLQKKITSNVVDYLKVDKPLIYITCSVFKEENEEIINFLIQEHGLKLEMMQILKGYEVKADTLFVARLLKSH